MTNSWNEIQSLRLARLLLKTKLIMTRAMDDGSIELCPTHKNMVPCATRKRDPLVRFLNYFSI